MRSYYIFLLFSSLLLSCIKATYQNAEVFPPCETTNKIEAQSTPVDSELHRYSESLQLCTEASSLILAVDVGDIGWAEYEIERGADVNKASSITASTSLTLASFDGSIDIVKLLLEHEADPNIARNDDGKTKASNGATPLLLAVGRNNYETVKLLLEHGADPNIPRSDNGKTGASDGSTPLVLAAQGGYSQIVRLLLEHGADPDEGSSDNGKTKASDGATPLGAAVVFSHADIVKLLLAHGASPDKGRSGNGKAHSADGATSLMLAAGYRPNVEIARMLLEAGANLDIKSSDGGTAYQYAKRYGTAETVKLLEGYMSERDKLLNMVKGMGK